mmetsp:Transcript_6782/g.15004  ORF Transcript_6782/g.15004 Transcript_6782/m.15004 type:complete len:238 (+) Transcript_6782:505-1218(+)
MQTITDQAPRYACAGSSGFTVILPCLMQGPGHMQHALVSPSCGPAVHLPAAAKATALEHHIMQASSSCCYAVDRGANFLAMGSSSLSPRPPSANATSRWFLGSLPPAAGLASTFFAGRFGGAAPFCFLTIGSSSSSSSSLDSPAESSSLKSSYLTLARGRLPSEAAALAPPAARLAGASVLGRLAGGRGADAFRGSALVGDLMPFLPSFSRYSSASSRSSNPCCKHHFLAISLSARC